MTHDTLFRLADHELLRELESLCSQDRETTAGLLAHIGEADARKLFAPAGYSSMFRYCVHHLHMSEHTAFKRIRVARAARRFGAILPAVADGRVHLAALVELIPHMMDNNADELIAAATHRTRWQVLEIVKSRFGEPPILAPSINASPNDWMEQLAPGLVGSSNDADHAQLTVPESSAALVVSDGLGLAPPEDGRSPISSGHSSNSVDRAMDAHDDANACGRAGQTTATREEIPSLAPKPYLRLRPAPSHLVEVQGLIPNELFEQLRWAQALLGHAVPSGDLVEIFRRAVGALVKAQENRRFGAGSKSSGGASGKCSRYIPAAIRREVLERDGGRCTFIGHSGHRCENQFGLEFDHITPQSRGGASTTANLRLRCRTHNQLEAERVFGAGFMEEKRGSESRRAGEQATRPIRQV